MSKLAEETTQAPVRTDDPPGHVHIKNDRGHVSRNEVHISKKAEEQVYWTHHGNKDATIVFENASGSPFQRPQPIIVRPGERIASGPLNDEAAVGAEYKYTVIGSLGKNDPVVIIDN